MLLALASAVFLGSESLGTRDHILLSQTRDFPFYRLLRLAGSRWRYSTPPTQGLELIAPTVLIITSRDGPRRKHRSSFLHSCTLPRERVYLSCCPETTAAGTRESCVLVLLCALPRNGRCIQSRRSTTGLYATLCWTVKLFMVKHIIYGVRNIMMLLKLLII
jgi:hypothetical protein